MIRFGTAGWRALIAQDFTFQNVRILSQAIADYLKSEGQQNRQLMVGYDTRFLSEHFARTVTEVMAANSIQVLLCDKATPTPALAWQILKRKTSGSVNVTASHNPYDYLGIKFSSSYGGPAQVEVTRWLEERCLQIARENKTIPHIALTEARRKKLLVDFDPAPDYFKQIHELIDFKIIKSAKLKVVADMMYGTATGYMDQFFKEATQLTVLHDWRDVLFGGVHPEPAKENLTELIQTMKKVKAHIGFGTDGDSDRFGIVDSDGSFLSPNEILPLALDHLVRTRGWSGITARSVMTSHFLDAVARFHGVELRETPVGFKYIAELMLKEEFIIGGEESGGLTVKGHIPDKDGILACLLMAEVRAASKKPLRECLKDLQKKVGFFYTDRMNFHLAPEKMDEIKDALATRPPTQIGTFSVKRIIDTDGTKFVFKDGSWLGIRLSGTEPLVRLYAEADDTKKLAQIVQQGKKLVESF